jgi:hypothetical protein
MTEPGRSAKKNVQDKKQKPNAGAHLNTFHRAVKRPRRKSRADRLKERIHAAAKNLGISDDEFEEIMARTGEHRGLASIFKAAEASHLRATGEKEEL